jgi:hypothetical protein
VEGRSEKKNGFFLQTVLGKLHVFNEFKIRAIGVLLK